VINKKKIIVIAAVSLISFLALVFYKRKNTNCQLDIIGDGNGYVRNQARSYNYLLSSGKFLPSIILSYSTFSFSNRSANNKNIRWLYNTYDSIVSNIALSLNLPKSLIYAVMLTESGSLAAKAEFNKRKYETLTMGNISGAVGPMQIKRITATETIQIALSKGLLTKYHKNIIQRQIGVARTSEIFALKASTKATYQSNKVIGYSGPKSELNAPELNILIAALKLVNLVDNYGVNNLHQVFYAYNQGDRTVLVNGLSQYTKIAQFMTKISGEGKTYVSRMLALNGSMDIVINDLKIFK
jgi:hypothetical protein